MSDEERNNVFKLKPRTIHSEDADDSAEREAAEIIDMVNMLSAHERRFRDILSKMEVKNEEMRITILEKDQIIKQRDSEIVELKHQIALLQENS